MRNKNTITNTTNSKNKNHINKTLINASKVQSQGNSSKKTPLFKRSNKILPSSIKMKKLNTLSRSKNSKTQSQLVKKKKILLDKQDSNKKDVDLFKWLRDIVYRI